MFYFIKDTSITLYYYYIIIKEKRMDYKNNGIDLLNFIKQATSPFHVVESSASLLDEAGFTSLDITEKWSLEVGHSYYTIPFGTTLFAFT